jgi:transposase InsO family protein
MFTSAQHQQRLRHPRRRSRGAVVDRSDRAVLGHALAESFFTSLKGECLDLQPWPTRAAARRATVDYIAWYNGARLHSALGYQTPDQYESITRTEVTAQAA